MTTRTAVALKTFFPCSLTLFTIVVPFHIHVFLLTQFMIHIQQTCNRRLVWPARSQVEASRRDPIDHGVHSKGCYGHQRSGILKFQGSGQLLFPKSQLQSHPLPGRRYPTWFNSGKDHLHFNFGCEWRYFGPFSGHPLPHCSETTAFLFWMYWKFITMTWPPLPPCCVHT